VSVVAENTARNAAFIGLDWGTSSLRAYLMDASGVVLAEERRPWGIMQLPPAPQDTADTQAHAGFERAFDDICGTWLQHQPDLPVLACGMVGSAQGWKEAVYLDAPASLDQLALKLTRVEHSGGKHLHIVPGLIQRGALPDVMRGEETQVLGVMATTPDAATLLIGLPGTHSKWVLAGQGGIAQFTTYMTGEVFSALRQNTILGRTMQTQADVAPDDAAFMRGLNVALSGDSEAGLLSQIFSTRTLGLTGALSGAAQPDYLSGLLIGNEVTSLVKRYAGSAPEIVLCGEADLCRRYALALHTAGFAASRLAPQATARGLWQIACAAGLVPEI
jgi:2-dehydro-3-deoxygalactonokinase